MAAAGVLEAIVAAQTCATGIVPPTVNLRHVDEGCELDHVIGEPRDVDARDCVVGLVWNGWTERGR